MAGGAGRIAAVPFHSIPKRPRLAILAGVIIGQIGMLFAVILIIRVLPEGLSSVLVRRGR